MSQVVPTRNDMRKLLLSLSILFVALSFSASISAQDVYEEKYQWQIPGGKYIDPVSFFSLHGYVNAVYAGASDEWQAGNFNGIGMPGQVILPNSNNASFSNDEALWISSDLEEYGSVVMELHLVADPSGQGAAGPGGLTIVLTEANLRYQIIPQYLAISAGTFWSVFGIQNQDWLGAQNLFSTVPLASGAYPTHYNEKGIRLDGWLNRGSWGLNYVFSLGNGFNAFDISGYNSFDLNENKMLNGRVSVYPGMDEKLNLGFSYSRGLLSAGDVNADPNSMAFYDNNFQAFGLDLTWFIKNFKLRGYLISSREILESNNGSINLPHLGTMGELSYSFSGENLGPIQSIAPKVRYDYLDKSAFVALNSDTYQNFSFGLNFQIHDSYILSLDYNVFGENNTPLNNNRFVARMSAKF